MMNENVKKVYTGMLEVENALKNSSVVAVDSWLDRLVIYVTPLLEEEQYAFYAESLLGYVRAYKDHKVKLDFIQKYLSKLIELIEVTNKPARSEEAKAMYEEAKNVCADIAGTAKVGFQVAKETIKSEGPRYVAEAATSLKEMGKKIGDGFKKWLDEDDSKEGSEGREEE